MIVPLHSSLGDRVRVSLKIIIIIIKEKEKEKKVTMSKYNRSHSPRRESFSPRLSLAFPWKPQFRHWSPEMSPSHLSPSHLRKFNRSLTGRVVLGALALPTAGLGPDDSPGSAS